MNVRMVTQGAFPGQVWCTGDVMGPRSAHGRFAASAWHGPAEQREATVTKYSQLGGVVSTRQALVVQMSGELTTLAVSDVADSVRAATTAAGAPAVVVLDLRGVTLLPAAGMRVLFDLVRSIVEQPCRCRLVIDPDSLVGSVWPAPIRWRPCRASPTSTRRWRSSANGRRPHRTTATR
ncbi:STAS domain-containing protein [Amycolatopsis sp. NPDC004368]